MDDLQAELAATAARLVVEEGLDYGAAKRRSIRQLGLPARTALPDNERVEDAVREYIALFCADTQAAELRVLRQTALVWMQRLAEFRPHLAGAVWRGTATRLSPIHLQLFCDDPKSAELALINQGVRYEVGSVQGFQGDTVDALSISVRVPQWADSALLLLMIYDHDDLRGALKPDARGRTLRGTAEAVKRLLDEVQS